jgi:transposase-like protein
VTSSHLRVGRTSGKIQKPGPDSPGGPRVERTCEVCQEPFWPRAVDVAAGKGRHCSTNCSSKALRKPKLCACGKPRSDKARQCRACSPSLQRKRFRCEHCGAEFARRTRKASRRFCSPEHARAALRAKVTIAGVDFSVAELASVLGTSSLALRDKLRQRRNEPPEQALFRHRRWENGGRRPPLTFNGETLTRRAWAARLGISYQALSNRLKFGWSLEKALTTPGPAATARRSPSSR